MLIFSIIVFVLIFLFVVIKRHYHILDVDNIDDIIKLVSNSDIDHIEVSSKFFGVTKLSFSNKPSFELEDVSIPAIEIIKETIEVDSPIVGTFHWEFPKIPEKSSVRVRVEHMFRIKKYNSTGCVGRMVKKGEIIAYIEHLGGLKELILSPIDGKIIKGIAIPYLKKDSPVDFGMSLVLIEEL